MISIFENITRLGVARRRSTFSEVAIFDKLEGAGNQPRKVTVKELNEMMSPYQGIKGHEVGEGNNHTGNNSLSYGEDLVTGIPERPFTCALGGAVLTVTGLDVSDDFRIGDVVRIHYGDNTLYVERIVNGSVFSAGDTTLLIDSAVPGIVAGVLTSHSHGSNCVNVGINNQIKGNASGAIGVGARIYRDVVGALAIGIRNIIRHGAVFASGQDGDSNWTQENYQSAPLTAAAGDAKASTVMMKLLTTNATPGSLTLADGSLLLLPAGASVFFEVFANAVQTGGAAGTAKDSYCTHIRGLVKNIAGAITIVDQEEAYTSADGAFNGTLVVQEDDVNGAITLLATGEASKNISWTAQVKMVMNIAA